MFKGVWEQFQTLLSSPIFLACVSSWFLAQFLKTLIKLFAGKVHSIKELVELQELIGANNCSWSVIEDIYSQTKVCAGILVDTTT